MKEKIMNKNYLLIFSSLLLLRSAFASSLQFDNPQGTTPEIRASCVQEATAEPFSDAMSSLISEHLADSPGILLDYPGLHDETRARIVVDLLNRLPIISETIDEYTFALANSSTLKNETKVNM